MGQALYRKYRSKSLDEVIGQEHITTTLKNAIKSGKISHAYLLTGPRGVGKTSVARILAYEINGIPYSDNTGQHIDIIEIDAASNRRIDEIRELRDKVNVAPTSAKYKVYIIDEVHMLTKEAFNALLKTLEEPPAHVVFILATTEAHKVPETIVSRTQRFTFRPIDDKKALEHLKKLAQSEKISIDDESLQLIVEHAQGSFRDSISLLDQLGSTKNTVTPEVVRDITGIPPETAVKQLIDSLVSGTAGEMINQLEGLYNAGYQPSQIAKQLSKKLGGHNASKQNFILLKQLLEVPVSHDPGTYLELILLESTLERGNPQAVVSSQVKEPPKIEETLFKKDVVAKKPTEKATGTLWDKALESLKGRHNTLYGIARMADASEANDKMTLTFAFPFHQRRCNEARNREKIEAIMQDLSGKKVTLECIVGKTKTAPKPSKEKHKPKETSKSDTLDSITEVFGGGEVLE